MEWRGRRGSRNIEDRRRSGGSRAVAGGGGLGVIAIVIIAALFGVDMTSLLGNGGPQITSSNGGQITQADEDRAEFTSIVLADTEEVWAKVFREQVGREYRPPQLVLFSGAVQAGACGMAQAATGPFYCPGNSKAYLDTDFFVTLDRQLGAKGDFAAAYVVAHEIAHHVQNELGILGQANRVRAQVSQAESNQISVRIELQADCYSGIWAREAADMFGTIDRSDITEAVNAAKEIGDDTLQREAGRRVRPESFTHGTSAQRQSWFIKGFQTGSMKACDTFSARRL